MRKTKNFMEGFHYDAHPMGMLTSTVAALSTFYPDSRKLSEPETRMLQVYRLIGKMPTIASYAYRNRMGLPYVYPDNNLSYTGNFLNMMYRMSEARYKPDPALEHALDVLFILHAGSRTELQHQRHAQYRQLQCRSVRSLRRRGGCLVRASARRRQRSGVENAQHHRFRGTRSRSIFNG